MITQAQAELVRATAREAFFKQLNAAPPDSMIHPVIATRMPSDSDQETYAWLGQSPMFQEWQGVRGVKGLPTQSYVLRNKKFEATLAVENDLIRRDKLGQVTVRAADLGRRAIQHTEMLAIDALLLGESTNGYDGQFFFDTDHADPGASFTTSQDNDLTGAAATGTNPTAAEMEIAVEAMLVKLRTYKDDTGMPWNFAEDLHWLVPPVMEKAARIVLESNVGSVAADSTGVTGAFRGTGKLHVSAWLPARQAALGQTADNRIYLFNAAGMIKPLIYQVEKEPEFDSLGAGSDHSFKTDTTLFGGMRLCNVGHGVWQHAVLYTFS